MFKTLLAAAVALAVPQVPATQTTAPEVHGIGLYQGRERTGDAIHGPRADVLVDRPGRAVVLTLCSYEPVRWRVETTPGTDVRAAVLHGYGRDASEILLNSQPFAVAETAEQLPCYRETRGAPFRRYVRTVGEMFGATALGSAAGAYEAPVTPFVLDAAPGPAGDRTLRTDPLADLPRLNRLPPTLERVVRRQADQPDLRRDGDTLIVGPPGDAVAYPPGLDVPRVSWPVGTVLAEDAQRAFLVTLGGEGFLYGIDLETGAWSVLASMENRDVGGIGHDPGRDVVWAVDRRGGSIEVIGMGAAGTVVTEMAVARLPGLVDLYGRDVPEFDVIAAADGLLLVRTVGRHGGAPPAGTMTYFLDVGEGSARLVTDTLLD